MPFSQIIPPSPSPTESKRLFYTSVSFLLSRIQGYRYHLSKCNFKQNDFLTFWENFLFLRTFSFSLHSLVAQMVKVSAYDAGDPGLIPGSGRSPGEGNGNPLQYSCLENPRSREAWWAAIYEVAQSRTQLSDFTFIFHFHALEKEMATHSSVLAWRIPGMGSLVGCRLWGCTESNTTEAT